MFLTEFDPRVSPQEAILIVILLVSDGWVPVIAHAERYPNLRCDGELDEILSQGCLLQINAYSLANEEDQETREWISLDDIRSELHISPADNQGAVIQEARTVEWCCT